MKTYLLIRLEAVIIRERALSEREIFGQDRLAAWEFRWSELRFDVVVASRKVADLEMRRKFLVESTGVKINWFTRWFFDLAITMHVRVPCLDEAEITEAVSLDRRLTGAYGKLEVCRDRLALHNLYKPQPTAKER